VELSNVPFELDEAVSGVILVEGESDANAIVALSRRQGRDLAADAIAVVPMGGVTNIGHYLDSLGPAGRGLELAGLCDVGEEAIVLRALEGVGIRARDREEMERAGFFVCEPDLEGELIRGLGHATVERVIEEEGELRSLRRFQAQPAQRGRMIEAQLRRFIGTRSGRKAKYGALLVEALDSGNVPRPLAGVLSRF